MLPFKEKNYRTGKEFDRYRGTVRLGPRDYIKVVLFTDFELSKRELRRRQRESDEEAHDPTGVRRRKYQCLPIKEHLAEYMGYLRRTAKNTDHPGIAEGMLCRLIGLANWHRLADITQSSMEAALKKLSEKGDTVTYQNDYIKKAKAFVHWCMPERLAVDPLAKLKRANTTRALKRRARRPGTPDELQALFQDLPESMQLAVAFMLLTGFRRGEAESLCWDDLRLHAPIPFIQLRSEWTKNENADALPLHRVLVDRLKQLTPGMPATRVFRSILECETFEKYLGRAGVAFVNERGLRLDVHALRHTFSSWLDEVGCPWTWKKALTRHAQGEVADRYSHSRLAMLNEFVQRLPSPWGENVSSGAVMTGTDPNGCGASASVLSAAETSGFPGNSHKTDKSTWVLGRGLPTISLVPQAIKSAVHPHD
jgi:integrase